MRYKICNYFTDGEVANLDLKSYCLQKFHKQQPKRNDNYKSKSKSTFQRTSTLMKPTASQLAKQNQERLVDNSRYNAAKIENILRYSSI